MIKAILLFVMKPTILVGGQAVIEGVMMRVPGAMPLLLETQKERFILIEKSSDLLVKNHKFGDSRYLEEWQGCMSQ